LAARVRGPAYLDIVTLAVCLMGLLGLISTFLEFKAGVLGIPRVLFLLFLAMMCAPFYVALVRTPKFPFLFPPVVVIFLLFAIAAPHGVIYGTDPIFNFSFTDEIVRSGFWSPGTGNAFAHTYSFYPLGNVFMGYVILATGVPGTVAYLWIEPLLRLIALPATIFAIGRRLFSTRIAILGLFFYLGTASILFNTPVQQGMGIVFVGLSLLSLVMLTRSADKSAQRRAQVLFMLVAGGIVMTHHLSSYIFAGWLATLAVFMSRPRFRPAIGSVRLGVLFLYFIGLLALYITFFTYSIFLGHEQNLETVIYRLVAPENFPPAGTSAGLGRTFTTGEIAWVAGSVFALLVLALISLYRFRKSREHPFAVANGLVATTVTIVTLPLVTTGFNFVTLRIGEYTNLFVAPFAAATLIRWAGASSGRWGRLIPRFTGKRDWLPRAACVAIAAAILMGGNLAPASTRSYFESPLARTTDSPLNFGSDAIRASTWTDVHIGRERLWGDQLAIDGLAGFANMEVDFGSSRIFTSTALNATEWSRISVGDYIAVDRWMLTLRPNFFQEPALTANLTAAQVGKFARDPHLALVYQDATFSLYRVMSTPPR